MKKKPAALPGAADPSVLPSVLPSVAGQDPHRNPPPLLRNALIIAAYLFAFIILDITTKQFERLPGIVAWYPPAGLTYSLLLIFGVGFAPAVIIALFISSLFIYRMPQPSYFLFLWACLSSLIYSLAAAFLRRRIRFDWQLRKLRDVTWLVLTAMFVSALLAILSVVGSALSSDMPRSEVIYAIFEWWIGETVGVLTITPFLLIFVMPVLKRFTEGQPLRSPSRRSFPHPTPSAIGQTASLVLILYLVFGAPLMNEFYPLYLITLPIIWIALDHGIKGVSAGLVALNFGVVLALWFFRFDPAQIGELELLMIVTCIAGLLMGAVVTERKQADESLRESEERYRTLIEQASDGIFLADSAGRYIEVNSAGCHLLGYTREEILQKTIRDLTKAAPAQPLRLDELRQGKTILSEREMIRKDGTLVQVEISAKQLPDGRLQGITRDITERKQAEEGIVAAEKRAQELLVASNQSRHALLSMVEDQQRTEEKLAASEAELRSLFAAMTDMVIVYDADGRYVKVAPTKPTSFYRPLDDILGKTVYDILPKEQADYIVARLRESIQSGETVNGEYALQLDGKERWYSASASRLSENTAIWVAHDITERKQAEERLKSSEARYRQAITAAGAVPYYRDYQKDTHTFTFMGEGILQLTGYSAVEITPDIFDHLEKESIMRGSLAHLTPDEAGKLSETGDIRHWACDYCIQTRDGQIRWLSDSAIQIRDENNRRIGVIGILQDITERKKADDELRQRMTELEMLYESGLALNQLLSPQEIGQKIIQLLEQKMDWHHTAIRLYHPQDKTLELLAFSQPSLNNEGERRMVEERFNNYISKSGKGLTGWAVQNSQIVRNGNVNADPRYAETYPGMYSGLYVPMKSNQNVIGVISIESGKPNAFNEADERLVATLANQAAVAIENARLYQTAQQEIVERKRVEILLADERNQLARRVDERTADLSVANSDLTRALRSRDEFLASMSHELRTPLTGILGFSEILQLNTYGELNEKQRKAVNIIDESGRHLLDLISDILDLSKVEAGKLELQFTPCSIADVCLASLQLTKGMAQQKKQNIQYSPLSESIIVHADARRLKQILVNLLGNAVKFTPEGGGLGLEIQANASERKVRLTVWDKGIGIKSEDMHKLFKPFVQIDSSLAREYSGTGLGLSLVKRLVELHNGGIEVESVFGEGSRFAITLPWTSQDTIPIPRKPQRGNTGELSSSVMPPEYFKLPLVMFADDNELVLKMVADFLETKQYRVMKVRNGAELLESAAEFHPDILLVDIQMPHMDGLETIRRIRSHPDALVAAAPVIVLTALVMPGDRETCLRAGANDYMSKPVRLKELVAAIQKLLEDKK